MTTKTKKILGFIWKFFAFLLATPLLILLGLIIFLSITEFRPEKTENLKLYAEAKAVKTLETNKLIRIASWNIGYAALGAKQDFFMDGGSIVLPETKEDSLENINGIVRGLKDINANIILLQESDRSSKRSYYINHQDMVSESENMAYASAINYKCAFVPYPIPFTGKVESGLATFSHYKMSEAKRESLPVTFKWPVSLAHLKRCLLVSRFPLESGKTLVLINLHLEAFDDGPGRLAQTKVLMDILKEEYAKGNYVIAGGDFNQTFPNKRPKAFAVQSGRWHPGKLTQDMLPKNWRYASDDSAPTCRSTQSNYIAALKNENIKKNWQYYLLDGFILSPNVKMEQIKTMDNDFLYSDHNPVYMDFILIE